MSFKETLNTTHVVFVGDSVSRYQYLALAYYLVHERVLNRSLVDNISFEKTFGSHTTDWQRFFYFSSSVLTSSLPSLTTSEVCFCTRSQTNDPVRNREQRHFQLHSRCGTRISISFIQYVTELHLPFASAFSMLHNLRPSHVFVNFGLWVDGDREKAMPEICSLLTDQHAFQVFWQDTTPRLLKGKSKMGSRLVAPCKLSHNQIVPRFDIVVNLTGTLKQRMLYWDKVHFHGYVSHAFNEALLAIILKQQVVSS